MIPQEDCLHGSAAMGFVPSAVSGRPERIFIYLLPGHMCGDARYPVLQLQHGYRENETTWASQGKISFICDGLIAQGKAVPAIVVMRNGMLSFPEGDGQSIGCTEEFEQTLVRDVREIIPYVDSHYRTYADWAHRAVAGLSKESIQAYTLSLRYPALFSHVGLFSGLVQDPLIGWSGMESSASEKIYPGLHEWKVRQHCLHDF